MERVFLELLNMSITASWLVLAVIIIRLLLKNAPKFIRCIMWALVGIRLICPFSFESSLSLIPSAETVPQEIIYSQTPSIDSGVSVLNQTVNPIISDSLAPEIGASVNPVQVVLFVASVLWIAGIAAMLIYTLISYIRIHRKVREAIELKDNVWICDHIDTPFIFGVFRPRIFLPSSMNEADMRHVISHERAHLARYDHLWKPIGFLLLTVYWFNPVLWIAYILLCRDIEMACDEKVIKEMGIENKKSYSEALINCSVPRKMIAACPLAFGEMSVKSRIKGVLNYKKPAFWLVITAVVSCIVVAVCFLTNPSGVKLTQLKEDISFEKLFDNVERLEVVSGEMGYATEEPGTIAEVINILKEVKISRNPISKSRAEDRDRTNTITINNGNTLCFSKDCSEYWVYTGVKPTFSYKVMNPETVKKAFEIERLSSFSGTIDSKYYFDATVLETGTPILVEPFEEAQERKSSDKIYVSTNVSGEQAVPELKVGDEVRIYYDGLIMETYPAQIGNVYEICLLKELKDEEHSTEAASEPETESQTEEITTEEVTTEATTEETTEETTRQSSSVTQEPVQNVPVTEIPTEIVTVEPTSEVVKETEPEVTYVFDEPYHIEVSKIYYIGDSSISVNALNFTQKVPSNNRHLPTYKFESKAEIDAFIDKYSDEANLTEYMPFFSEGKAKYNNTFFESKALILAYVEASSGSYQYGVKGIDNNGQSFVIHVEQINYDDDMVGTADMAGHFVTVAVDKDLIKNCTVFDADVEEPWR